MAELVSLEEAHAAEDAVLGELGLLPRPDHICLLGFADTRNQAPYDGSFEIWGCNDVYAHVPRVDRTFELHHLDNLGNRRNPQYFDWMAKGKHPIYMIEPQPNWPTAKRFPFEWLQQQFPRRYFTNSIAWMQALAIMVLTEFVDLPDGRRVRLGRNTASGPATLAMFGIHMAAESEYAAQRPCCEYYAGLCDGVGVPLLLAEASELLKSGAIYGLDTTLPLRIKAEKQIVELGAASQQVEQQLAQIQAQREALLVQQGMIRGRKDAWKEIRQNWTMATDRIPTPEERQERHAIKQPNGHVQVSGDLQVARKE